MTNSEMRKLDAWIADHVMHEKPLTQSRALNKEETAMALWDDGLITRKDVREFCEKNPEYHYKECEVYASYTTSPAAFDVLKKCLEKFDINIAQTSGPEWIIESFSTCSFAPTLELAICKFAKAVFTEQPT